MTKNKKTMILNMRRLLLSSALTIIALQGLPAQTLKMAAEGTPYYLPRTKLCFTVKVEKTTYTLGDFAIYAEKYLRLNDVSTTSGVSYRLIGLSMHTEGDRDTSKLYVAPTDAKHAIQTLEIDDNGCLSAINAAPKVVKAPAPFTPAPKPAPLNPRNYMNEEILSAGSSAKMAELCALEIYDIRENRSELNKGQADFMPKDGEQLRIMLANLDTQERALTQLFSGITVKDTTETVIEFMPEGVIKRQPLFRFSKWAGLVPADDLSGNPYYISVEDLKKNASVQDRYLNQKEVKDNGGVYVNQPGKIKVSIFSGNSLVSAYELYAGQYGHTVMLNDALFRKQFETSLVLNPVTGSASTLKAELVKK